jgi:hypothetical protein
VGRKALITVNGGAELRPLINAADGGKDEPHAYCLRANSGTRRGSLIADGGGAGLTAKVVVNSGAEAMNPLQSARRCGARTRQGTPCRAPAIHGKHRCRMHGGRSTGPRTPEGLERSRRARWKHGRYSKEAREARARERATRPPSDAERRAAMRRFERDGKRAARQTIAAFRRVWRRLGSA